MKWEDNILTYLGEVDARRMELDQDVLIRFCSKTQRWWKQRQKKGSIRNENF